MIGVNTMPEYIERDEAVRKAISACIKIVGHGITQIDAVDIADEIDSIPTADVAEVVRCKDCRYWGGVIFGYVCRRFSGATLRNETRENDFCSFGAKMDRKGCAE